MKNFLCYNHPIHNPSRSGGQTLITMDGIDKSTHMALGPTPKMFKGSCKRAVNVEDDTLISVFTMDGGARYLIAE